MPRKGGERKYAKGALSTFAVGQRVILAAAKWPKTASRSYLAEHRRGVELERIANLSYPPAGANY